MIVESKLWHLAMTLPILDASPLLVVGGRLDAVQQGSREGEKVWARVTKSKGQNCHLPGES